MADSKILIKRNTTNNNAPAADSLSVGELAVNLSTGVLYAGKGVDGTTGTTALALGGQDASDSVKGIASFDSSDFSVSSGNVTLGDSADGAVLAVSETANETSVSRSNGTVTVGIADNPTIPGNLGITGTLHATGNATFGGTADIASNLDVTGTLGVTGNATFRGTIDAQGTTTTTLTATSNADVAGTLGVTGAATFRGDVNAESGVEVTGNLGVTGTATFRDNVTIASNKSLTVGGDLIVEGTTTTVNSSTVTIDDSQLKLADGNTSSDAVDIGVYGEYSDGTDTMFSGFFRDATDGEFNFYKGLKGPTYEPGTTVDTATSAATTGYELATVNAIIDGGSYS